MYSLFYLVLPVYVANMLVVFLYFRYTKDFKGGIFTPIDHNKTLGKNNNPILGPHLRFDGPILYVVISILVVLIQFQISRHIPTLENIYSGINIYLLGFLLGFGSWFGAVVKAFIKRRLDWKPHKPFFVLDQIDHIVGAFLFSYLLIHPTMLDVLIITVLTIPLVIIINFISFKLHIKDVWW